MNFEEKTIHSADGDEGNGSPEGTGGEDGGSDIGDGLPFPGGLGGGYYEV